MSRKQKRQRKVEDLSATPDASHQEPVVADEEIDDADLKAEEKKLAELEAKAKALKAKIGKQKQVANGSKKLDHKRKWARQNFEWLEGAALRFAKRMLTMNQATSSLSDIEVGKFDLPEKQRESDKYTKDTATYQEAFESLPKKIRDQAAEGLKQTLSQ